MLNSKKLTKIALLSASFILVAGFIVFGLEKIGIINLYNSTPPVTNGPTPQQKAQEEKTNTDAKQQFLDKTYQDKNNADKPAASNNPTLSITTKQEAESVTILTKIQSVSEGTCNLTATNGANTITQEAKVIYQPEFSSCAGFSVPISGLGIGTWNITLVVNPVNSSAITRLTTLDVK
mgnify:CR=1 FL=1|jgi:hypothetical protein